MEFNLFQVVDAVAQAVPERPWVLWRDQVSTYGSLRARTLRLAEVLRDNGIGLRTERPGLAGHVSGQDHVALCLHDVPAYLETMLAAFGVRAAPCNVDHRYTEPELLALLDRLGPRAIVFHGAVAERLAPVVEALRTRGHRIDLCLQVDDASGAALLPGAQWYEDALVGAAGSHPHPPALPDACSPDDLYVLCTGGTTGPPRAVLWRQGDVFTAAMGGRDPATGAPWNDLESILENARCGGRRFLPAAPFAHGAAQWMAFHALTSGQTLVLRPDPDRFDAQATLRTIAEHRVTVLLIVGDAFARPLLEAIDTDNPDLSSLTVIASGGAGLASATIRTLLDRCPHVTVVDGLGASETGSQGSRVSTAADTGEAMMFAPAPGTVLVSEDRTSLVCPGDPTVGWIAQASHVPLGYLGDPEATARAFPEISGRRVAIAGDRGRWTADGRIVLLGRDATIINSGGEKIFVEEVEQVLADHPGVEDVLVVGAPSRRWGQEVVAVVASGVGPPVAEADLLASCIGRLAPYKRPKRVVFVDRVRRTPAGKGDYTWAAEVATSLASEADPSA